MFYRKISKKIEEYFKKTTNPILVIDGARQIGKSFIIREIAQKKFENYIEINMNDDFLGDKLFEKVTTIESFYIQVSVIAGNKMKNKEDTLIFIDEIQVYPHLFTLLKPLKKDDKYTYICSGSQLGIALKKTSLIPMGSIEKVRMYPMDFEEFLLANNVGEYVIKHLEQCFLNRIPLDESLHNKMLQLFKTYLYVGGLPDAVKAYVFEKNVFRIRDVQSQTMEYYIEDATKYDKENKLKITRMYELIPSYIDNKVKRFQINKIEETNNARFNKYQNEFDYLIASGISLGVNAISDPKFPLIQSSMKNLIKLYYNDVGLLSYVLYNHNINAILNDESNVNLGAVYETYVAQELLAHGHKLYYFDKRKMGEVDFLIDDYDNLTIKPIEVKSGKDYMNYRALPKLVNDDIYNIKNGYVLSNNREIFINNKIIHLPIYFSMFL